jgi:hypothetical protein
MGINIGPLGIFFIFLGLKLSHTIDWQWQWITAPLWIGAGLLLLGSILGGGLFLLIKKLFFD